MIKDVVNREERRGRWYRW